MDRTILLYQHNAEPYAYHCYHCHGRHLQPYCNRKRLYIRSRNRNGGSEYHTWNANTIQQFTGMLRPVH